MRIDVNAFVGGYPWRKVSGASPVDLVAAMDRVGIDSAWVSHLPGVFWRDPTDGNAWLLEMSARNSRLLPVPAVHPGLAHWDEIIGVAHTDGAPAVRADPTFYGIDPSGAQMRALAQACGEADVPLLMSVKFEDGRQRHPNDRADELPPWAVRTLIRTDPRLRLVITHADRNFIEEVHFGSTPEEASRIWWDICWIWGAPEDHFETLLKTIGPARFLFGTGQPLRLPENAIAKLDLLDIAAEDRAAIESGNARAIAGTR